MSIKLMYITNDPRVAVIAENAGVDRIFVDMEYIGKDKRQGGMDSVKNHHTYEDIRQIKKAIKKAELLVRCNPIHQEAVDYCSSREEIDKIIESGADIVMLPYFETVEEVKTFIEIVNKRVRAMLLFETPRAREIANEIMELPGIDEAFIGLNDMSLGYHYKFMFAPLANGIVDELCGKFKKKGVSYGFGGLASLDGGLLPGKNVLMEHYRLGSSCVILSRSFCNTSVITDLNDIEKVFNEGIAKIRAFEANITAECSLEENRQRVIQIVNQRLKEMN